MSEQMFKLKEVEEILKLSRASLNLKVNSGEIKAFKIGNSWRVMESDLNIFIKDKQKG